MDSGAKERGGKKVFEDFGLLLVILTFICKYIQEKKNKNSLVLPICDVNKTSKRISPSPGSTLHQTNHLIRRPTSSSLPSIHFLVMHRNVPTSILTTTTTPLFPPSTAATEIDRL